jgi:hypothetical protein
MPVTTTRLGRFISPDTIVPHPANPQSFNRYSYCLNNPLKYIDPSGLTDVTVEQTPMTPEQIAYLGLLGITDYDTWYTITCAAGNQATIAGNSRVIYVGNLPDAVYNVANEMRKKEGDSVLNIGTNYTDDKGTLYLLTHYEYIKGDNSWKSWDQYYFSTQNNRWEMISTSRYDPTSWEEIGRGLAGGALSGAGIFITFVGCLVMYEGYITLSVPSVFLGGGIAYVGWELFAWGYNFGMNKDYYWANPFRP